MNCFLCYDYRKTFSLKYSSLILKSSEKSLSRDFKIHHRHCLTTSRKNTEKHHCHTPSVSRCSYVWCSGSTFRNNTSVLRVRRYLEPNSNSDYRKKARLHQKHIRQSLCYESSTKMKRTSFVKVFVLLKRTIQSDLLMKRMPYIQNVHKESKHTAFHSIFKRYDASMKNKLIWIQDITYVCNSDEIRLFQNVLCNSLIK